jgi:hypothetical protein
LIDNDLHRIVSPLSSGSVERAQISASDDGGLMETTINSEEKEYFPAEAEIQTKIPAELFGTIVAL